MKFEYYNKHTIDILVVAGFKLSLPAHI